MCLCKQKNIQVKWRWEMLWQQHRPSVHRVNYIFLFICYLFILLSSSIYLLLLTTINCKLLENNANAVIVSVIYLSIHKLQIFSIRNKRKIECCLQVFSILINSYHSYFPFFFFVVGFCMHNVKLHVLYNSFV